MRSGRLREQISIYKEVSVTDTDFGSSQKTYTKLLDTRAEVKYLGGAEMLMNSTVSNITNAQFIMRLREDIDETMQVEYRGDRYNIEYIEEDRRHRTLRLTTSKILN